MPKFIYVIDDNRNKREHDVKSVMMSQFEKYYKEWLGDEVFVCGPDPAPKMDLAKPFVFLAMEQLLQLLDFKNIDNAVRTPEVQPYCQTLFDDRTLADLRRIFNGRDRLVPDLFVIDLHLMEHDMNVIRKMAWDGISVFNILGTIGPLANTPVIFMSTTPEYINESRNNAINNFMNNNLQLFNNMLIDPAVKNFPNNDRPAFDEMKRLFFEDRRSDKNFENPPHTLNTLLANPRVSCKPINANAFHPELLIRLIEALWPNSHHLARRNEITQLASAFYGEKFNPARW